MLQIIEKLNKIINRDNQVIERFDKLVRDKEVSKELESDVDKLTKALNNLNISDRKVSIKQQEYKHWKPRK